MPATPRSRQALVFLLTFLVTCLPGTRGLEVLSIEGPSVVVNGSTPQLVLDCVFDVDEGDRASLVVKWYFNRQPYPVYQWIPFNEPQDLGMLKGRVNLEYSVSDDMIFKHRALAIPRPTTELSGEYTCCISSFESEDYKRKSVIVYAPASDMTMSYSKPGGGKVLVSCRAGGVYPAPNIAIYRSSPPSSRAEMEGARVTSQHFSHLGYFNISIELEAYDFELESETMFECVLTIPHTGYRLQEKIVYFPGLSAVTSQVSRGQRIMSCDRRAMTSLLLLLPLFLLHIH